MSITEIVSNIVTLLASALGAGIGGFFAFQIVIYQIKVERKSELETAINPFLFDLKLQCDKAKKICKEIGKLKSQKIHSNNWDQKCIQIIKDERLRLDDLHPNWLKIRSEMYLYSFTKYDSDILFQIISDLVVLFRYLAKEQSDAEKHIQEDITCTWVEKEYIKIVNIVNEIEDEEIKKKFFDFLYEE